MSRNTIKAPASVAGVGLHLGVECRLTFRPAASGSGIVFKRIDLPNAPTIPAHVDSAVLTERRTQLGTDPVSVHTVEHVLAAVGALEVDDLVIDIDGPEPPIADGSAKPFLDALQGAGIAPQSGSVQYLELREVVRFTDGDSSYEAFPATTLDLDVTIDFPHRAIGQQHGKYRI